MHHRPRETSHDLLTGMLSNTYMAQSIQTNTKPDERTVLLFILKYLTLVFLQNIKAILNIKTESLATHFTQLKIVLLIPFAARHQHNK